MAYPVRPLYPEDPARIGRYNLLGILGGGSMGRVYLGRAPGGRLVAVKVVDRGLAADPGFRRRFSLEVDLARRVSGAFTALVVDADLEAPQPWLATAYVAGPSLSEVVRDHGPMPVASVLALASGLAEGLGAVHAAGMVHRDVKPGNVLIAGDGPRIMDFGISRALAAGTLTDSGTTIGTPSFVSPEQVQGDFVGPASDIYSLGSVLVYAATGRSPFKTGDVFEIIDQIIHGRPDLSLVPMPLRRLVGHCLVNDPELRPTTDDILSEVGAPQFEEGWLPASIVQSIAQYSLRSIENALSATRVTGHAFISYVREDAQRVDRLQQALEAAGVPVWRDTADLWPGEDWRVKIRRAITDNALCSSPAFPKQALLAA